MHRHAGSVLDGRLAGNSAGWLKTSATWPARRRRERHVRDAPDVRHEIGREVSIECRHRRLVGRDGAEADEAVRPHKDGAAIGHAGLGRITGHA